MTRDRSEAALLAPQTPTAPAPVLSVRDLRTDYVMRGSVRTAVRGVSFDVQPQERLAIVGESGCGKSTLALSLLRLIQPPGRITGGSVRFGGRDLLRLPDRKMRKVRGKGISLIYQDPMAALDPIKSIGTQLIEAITEHQDVSRAVARRQAIDLLRDVEVPNAAQRLNDYPHQYSGGMRQRVVIAMALANQPELLIADEPTTALDVTTQAQILDLIVRLVTDRSASMILITHNLGLVAEYCTLVQVMYAGRVVERGTVDDLFANPRHPYTDALIASVPRSSMDPGARLTTIPGVPPSLAALPPGCAFEPRCSVGRGNPRCLAERPELRTLSGAGDGQAVECHFPLHSPPVPASHGGDPHV